MIHVVCNHTIGWNANIPWWIETYDPYKNTTANQPSSITRPAPFTPPGYPLPTDAKVYTTEPSVALNAIVGISFGAAAITIMVYTGYIVYL
jgi:hypothetical protein